MILILLFFLFVAISIWGWRGDSSRSILSAMASGGAPLIAIIIIIISIICGGPTTIQPTRYLIEKTPYRLIISTDVAERTFTDAYSVANADHIAKVCIERDHNFWGSEVNRARLIVTFAP